MLTPNPLIELDRSKNYSKMTNENDFFIAKTLQKSTLARKRNDGGNALDADKVEMIIGK